MRVAPGPPFAILNGKIIAALKKQQKQWKPTLDFEVFMTTTEDASAKPKFEKPSTASSIDNGMGLVFVPKRFGVLGLIDLRNRHRGLGKIGQGALRRKSVLLGDF